MQKDWLNIHLERCSVAFLMYLFNEHLVLGPHKAQGRPERQQQEASTTQIQVKPHSHITNYKWKKTNINSVSWKANPKYKAYSSPRTSLKQRIQFAGHLLLFLLFPGQGLKEGKIKVCPPVQYRNNPCTGIVLAKIRPMTGEQGKWHSPHTGWWRCSLSPLQEWPTPHV